MYLKIMNDDFLELIFCLYHIADIMACNISIEKNDKWQSLWFFKKAGTIIKQYQILETHSETNEI